MPDKLSVVSLLKICTIVFARLDDSFQSQNVTRVKTRNHEMQSPRVKTSVHGYGCGCCGCSEEIT